MVPGMKGFGVALVAVAALASSCSASPTTKPRSASTSNPQTSTSNPRTLSATLACFSTSFAPGTSQPDAALVGKTFSAAKHLTSGPDQDLRVVAQNGTCDAITSDLSKDRIDLWIVNDRVVKAVREVLPGTTATT
jgi:hypothetical protein